MTKEFVNVMLPLIVSSYGPALLTSLLRELKLFIRTQTRNRQLMEAVLLHARRAKLISVRLFLVSREYMILFAICNSTKSGIMSAALLASTSSTSCDCVPIVGAQRLLMQTSTATSPTVASENMHAASSTADSQQATYYCNIPVPAHIVPKWVFPIGLCNFAQYLVACEFIWGGDLICHKAGSSALGQPPCFTNYPTQRPQPPQPNPTPHHPPLHTTHLPPPPAPTPPPPLTAIIH